MKNRTNRLYLVGVCLTSFGIVGSAILGILIGLIEKNPLMFRIRLGWEADSFKGFLVFTIMLAVVGILLFIFGLMQNKSANSISEIENLSSRNYCHHCQVNVTPGTHQCPICSRELKE